MVKTVKLPHQHTVLKRENKEIVFGSLLYITVQFTGGGAGG